MTNQDKLLMRLREQDRKEFDAPVAAYRPRVRRSWLDKLAFVDDLDDLDLAEHYRFGG